MMGNQYSYVLVEEQNHRIDLSVYKYQWWTTCYGVCGVRDTILQSSQMLDLVSYLTFRESHLPHTCIAVHCGHFLHIQWLAVPFRKEHQRLVPIMLPDFIAFGWSSFSIKHIVHYISTLSLPTGTICLICARRIPASLNEINSFT